MKYSVSKILKNAGFFAVLAGITLYVIYKDNDMGDVIRAIKGADVEYLIAAVFAMIIFLFCEGINIGRSLKLFGHHITLIQSVKYAVIGFFFSSVTPSASGGQPMQIYYMHRDKIDVSHSALALMFELLSFVSVTVGMALVGFIYQRETITESMGNLKYLLLIGVALNVIVLLLLNMAIFSKKAITRLASTVVRLIRTFNKEKAEMLSIKLTDQIEEYRNSAQYFKQNKSIFAKTLMTTLIQMTVMYSIPYLIYLSFGLSQFGFAEAIAMQSVLYVAVSALPLPGALGVSESGFMILFRTMFPVNLLGSAMVLSRGISFYLFVLIGGALTAVFTFSRKKEDSYGLYNTDCRRRQGYSKSVKAVSGK